MAAGGPARFREDLRGAVADVIRPALARLRTALHDDILPAARSDEEPGLLHVRGGADAYPLLIRLHTSLDLAPADLHRIGLDEVARINDELAAVGVRVLGTADRRGRSCSACARTRPFTSPPRTRSWPQRRPPSPAPTRRSPAGSAGCPAADCAVVPMGDHEAPHGTIAYYRQPAPDGSRPGEYYVNT